MRFRVLKIGRALLLAILVSTAAPAFAGVERWTHYGPNGGAVSSVVLDPHTPSTLWIAAGLVYRSEDGGASFRLTASGLEGQVIQYLAVDPGPPGVLYATTGDFGDHRGLYRSQDGGEHWTFVAGGEESFTSVDAIAVAPGAPGEPGVLFLGVGGTVLRSADRGASFETAASFDWTITAIAPDLRNPGTVYVSTLYQRFKSTDSGADWTELVEDPEVPPFIHGFAVAPSDSRILYESGFSARGGPTWRSRDGGATWQGPFPFGGDLLAVDPVDPDTVYTGSLRGLFVSHDGGETFTAATNGVPTLDLDLTYASGVNAIVTDPARPRFALAATAKGLFSTENRGTAWAALPQRGLTNNFVSNFRIDRFDPAHWILSNQGSFYESHDRGRTFTPFADSLARTAQIVEIEPDPFVFGRYWAIADYTLYVSQDSGVTWRVRGFTGDSYHLLLPAPGIMLVSSAYGSVSRSTDAGHSWHGVQPISNPGYSSFRRLKKDPRSSRTIYGFDSRSDDAGRTWRPWHKFDTVGFDPFRPRTVHLAAGDTLYVTGNGGASFQVVGHFGLTGSTARVLDLVFDRDHRDVLYAVTYADGVLRSLDGGATWKPLNDGLPPPLLDEDHRLLQDPVNGQRFYYTGGPGLYRADFSAGPS
jgi:photosystem II stability/assembly factor-like uncharacterized protein